MKNIYKISFAFLLAAILCFSLGTAVLAQVGGTSVQTNSPTNIFNYQATLNGYIYMPYASNSNYVYFQWGSTISYGNQTNQQYMNNSGLFSQNISGLNNNSTYHYRAVAQGSYGTIYGQDMTFYTNQLSGGTITVNAGPSLYLNSQQTGILQGSGYSPNGNPLNYSWSCTGGTLSGYNVVQPVYTAPYVSNNYSGQTNYTCTLVVSDNFGNSNSASTIININTGFPTIQTNYASYNSTTEVTLNGTISGVSSSTANYVYFQWGTTTSYGNQTSPQVAGDSKTFSQYIVNLTPGSTYHFRAAAQGSYGTIYGQDMTFTTSNGTSTNVVYVPVITNYTGGGQVLGASTVSTGLTNNFLTDSFFLPLLVIVLGLWFYFSGEIYIWADRIKSLIKK